MLPLSHQEILLFHHLLSHCTSFFILPSLLDGLYDAYSLSPVFQRTIFVNWLWLSVNSNGLRFHSARSVWMYWYVSYSRVMVLFLSCFACVRSVPYILRIHSNSCYCIYCSTNLWQKIRWDSFSNYHFEDLLSEDITTLWVKLQWSINLIRLISDAWNLLDVSWHNEPNNCVIWSLAVFLKICNRYIVIKSMIFNRGFVCTI